MIDKYEFATQAIRTGHKRTNENEHSEAIFTTSSYVFDTASEAASVFSGETHGNIYSRFSNPTVQAFEKRLAVLEKGERCVATASGMAAISTAFFTLLKNGDHVIISRNVFGSIIILAEKYLEKFGVEVSFANLADVNDWKSKLKSNTKMLFIESPSNPLTQIADIKQLAELAHKNNSLLIVDNVYCTPVLQQPLALGADLVIHSATKYLDGQGRAVGGAIVGNNEIMTEILTFMKTAGPSMSPFNAWIFLKGLETLNIRMTEHNKNAQLLATWLEQHPSISKVHYPGLKSHPQYQLAKKQQNGAGGILSFELKGGQAAAWKLMDSTKMICISANIGDVKTIITHPATTTHSRLSEQQRLEAGITNSLVRISVGIESIEDIIKDLSLGI